MPHRRGRSDGFRPRVGLVLGCSARGLDRLGKSGSRVVRFKEPAKLCLLSPLSSTKSRVFSPLLFRSSPWIQRLHELLGNR
ncbi:hypothetical protein SDJN03_00919, partial [Cucurbita argyrosperma subsp. sororia]